MTDSLLIERIRPEHAGRFFDAVQSAAPQIASWIGSHNAPPTMEDVRSFIREWDEAWESGERYGFFAREESADACVGFGLLNSIHPRYRIANLGYWIRPESAGRGFATELARQVARFAFDELDLVRVELVIEPTNTASRRVAEKLGARQEGLLRNRLTINGEVRDALMYGLVPEDLKVVSGGPGAGYKSVEKRTLC
ncbi:MAG: GNAT family N-acetyltransferase [Rhodothermales bacterium]